MSHLPHVLEYRSALLDQGVTCPEQLNLLAQEPFINAIIRNHFKLSNSLGLSVDEEERVWQQLDCWNKVSPIKGAYIFESVKYRLNTLRKVLTEAGCPPAPVVFGPDVGEGQVNPAFTQGEAFEVLVNFLVAELVARHE